MTGLAVTRGRGRGGSPCNRKLKAGDIKDGYSRYTNPSKGLHQLTCDSYISEHWLSWNVCGQPN